ncbi:TetR/AcrR family transcriptional regulator [Mycolicibacterium novocastrense]|uniref:TetR/AcrR family transcriptional regulator n=1 Tax=Mycolicibacterium novocastrense TaxID=59813 RepID=UPI0009E9390A|nr:TetR/AcrR family transcriptional regulator [Mycolicibacterium novocastrense]
MNEAGWIPPTDRWTAREAEILRVALQVLQREGYQRLTVDEVARVARASKATVYKRWPSKADLVVAAFSTGVRFSATVPETGTLRGDLLQVGEQLCQHLDTHAAALRAVAFEASKDARLSSALQQQLADAPRMVLSEVLRMASARGEIHRPDPESDFCDLFLGYLAFRALVNGQVVPRTTVLRLVDHVLMPAFARPATAPKPELDTPGRP